MPDIPLDITVPDAWTTKVLDSFNTIADTDLRIEARGDIEGSINQRWSFTIPAKDGTETTKEFVERVFKQLAKAVVDLVDISEDTIRYDEEVGDIIPPQSDVPADIFT